MDGMNPIMVFYLDGKLSIAADQQGLDGEHLEKRF
jgi:hypothetical protein